ncbi:MAG: BamA/OMP85 family outer membrane protein, partial [Planktomarina sp.]
DPFNPREIRSAAQRIRALGLFGSVDVNAREGRDDSQVVVDVDVTEQSTGSFNFGANYNDTDGIGLSVRFQERNFLGRGQSLSSTIVWGEGSRTVSFNFAEPAFLNRDLRFGLNLNYRLTDNLNARYDTESLSFAPSLGFPAGDKSRLTVRAFYDQEKLFDVTTSSGVITGEAASGTQTSYGLGYTYSFDTRSTGIDTNRGFFFKFGQDYSLGGDQDYIRTNFSTGVEWKLARQDVTFTAELDGGMLDYSGATSRVTDRFFASSSTFRGFAAGGIGPREINGADNDALGGNNFAVARFEARFPLGLPEEYGFTGGAFYDVGSVWGLDQASINSAAGTILYEDFSLRSTAGLSLFWKTPIGPLRFNFSRPVNVESGDRTDNFDVTIDASF